MTSDKECYGLTISGEWRSDYDEVFTQQNCEFIIDLVEQFQPQLFDLLKRRKERQSRYDQGELPDFLAETAAIRQSEWRVAAIPHDLLDRRIEMTAPVERKMIIRALNTGSPICMADFEDSQSPTWHGVMQGHINLRDANTGNMEYHSATTDQVYKLEQPAGVIIARLRGMHLPEKHIEIDGRPIPACLMDFALYFALNYEQLLAKNSGVYIYIPKIQSYQEAAWWEAIFHYTEKRFGLQTGAIRATLLMETLPAAFEMDEILYSMRDHIVGFNFGRWDYIFSYIKTLRNHPDRILPDRQLVTMNQPFLQAMSRLLVQTCHKRGAFAIGGVTTYIPSKDTYQNHVVLSKVKADKQREVDLGYDGTWIAHPDLAKAAWRIFSQAIGDDAVNQLHISHSEQVISAEQLLQPCEGTRSEKGMRLNIRIALQYIESWISGKGCVRIYGLMEDVGTAEISRASIWQWIKHKQKLDNGQLVTKDMFRKMLLQEAEVVRHQVGETRWYNGKFAIAITLFDKMTTSEHLAEFLTLPGYEKLQ